MRQGLQATRAGKAWSARFNTLFRNRCRVLPRSQSAKSEGSQGTNWRYLTQVQTRKSPHPSRLPRCKVRYKIGGNTLPTQASGWRTRAYLEINLEADPINICPGWMERVPPSSAPKIESSKSGQEEIVPPWKTVISCHLLIGRQTGDNFERHGLLDACLHCSVFLFMLFLFTNVQVSVCQTQGTETSDQRVRCCISFPDFHVRKW